LSSRESQADNPAISVAANMINRFMIFGF